MSLGTMITRLADSRVASSQTVRHENGGTVCCFSVTDAGADIKGQRL